MKKLLAILLAVCLLLTLGIPAFAGAETTVLSSQKLTVNGKAVNCEKYNVDGSNYFKLRDLAYVLNGTDAQFNVTYDAASRTMQVTTGEPYHPTGTELNLSGGDKSSTSVASTQTLMIDGVKHTDITAYNIGDNNYFKLRDLNKLLGFGLEYNDTTRTMLITTGGMVEKTEMTAEEIYAACAPAVFYIEVYDKYGDCIKTGSGFFLDSSGTAVTNFHVISGAASAKITLSDSGKVCDVAGVYDWSEEEDWAVLKISGSGFPFLTVGSATTVVGGAEICAIGSPLGLQNTISQGIISNPNRKEGNMTYIQISAPISAGSSGGALLNKYGEVIGITSASYEEGQNLNLAIPMTYLAKRNTSSLTPFETAAGVAVSGSLILYQSYVGLSISDLGTYIDMTALADAGAYIEYYIDNQEIVSCLWDDWNGDDIRLYIYPEKVGCTTVELYLLSEDDVLLDAKSFEVAVYEDEGYGPYGSSMVLDEYYVEMTPGDWYWVEALVNPGDYDGAYYMSWETDDPTIVDCSWGEWYNNDTQIDLYLSALKQGVTEVRVAYKTEDGTVLDYEVFTVDVHW